MSPSFSGYCLASPGSVRKCCSCSREQRGGANGLGHPGLLAGRSTGVSAHRAPSTNLAPVLAVGAGHSVVVGRRRLQAVQDHRVEAGAYVITGLLMDVTLLVPPVGACGEGGDGAGSPRATPAAAAPGRACVHVGWSVPSFRRAQGDQSLAGPEARTMSLAMVDPGLDSEFHDRRRAVVGWGLDSWAHPRRACSVATHPFSYAMIAHERGVASHSSAQV